METGQIYSVSHDCRSVPIDSVLKEVDTAKIHFYILSGFVYTQKGEVEDEFHFVVDIQGLELSYSPQLRRVCPTFIKQRILINSTLL
jgi:hypothetical protein